MYALLHTIQLPYMLLKTSGVVFLASQVMLQTHFTTKAPI